MVTVPIAVQASAQTYVVSPAERLVAGIQDGGKVLFLLASENLEDARRLGVALRALGVPLNEIWASRTASAKETALAAFSASDVTGSTELDFEPERLLRRAPGPGQNRVLVGPRALLEKATGRSFARLEGAIAVFLPGDQIQLLGTLPAHRVVHSAEARGALAR